MSAARFQHWIVMSKRILYAGVCQALLVQGCAPPTETAVRSSLPVAAVSSSDLGTLRNGSGPVSKQVTISNFSDSSVQVVRWVVSCECLLVEPSTINVAGHAEREITLIFDPSKEGQEFTGNLLISVEAWGELERLGTFDVPVRVVAREESPSSSEMMK